MSSNIELWLAFGIPACFILLGFIVGCFEKLPVRMFEAAPLEVQPSYLQAMVERGNAAGCRLLATGQHAKYRGKLPGALMLSADGSTLAVVGDGTIIGLVSRSTILISRFKDQSFLFTVDQVGSAELDPMTRRQTLMKADFDELFTSHIQRLGEGMLAIPFPEDAGWSAVDQVYQTRVDRMVAAGMVRYVDSAHEFYCRSIRGSFRASIVHSIIQMLRPKNYLRHYKRQPG